MKCLSLQDPVRARRGFGISFALAAACGRNVNCIVTPGCPPPIAAYITVTAAGSNTPVTGVTVRTEDGGSSGCDGICPVIAGAGKHLVSVSAPGYMTTQLTITVTTHSRNASVYGPDGYEGRECDCQIVDQPLQLSVSLVSVA